jgi:Sec-independent protein translocase protein TatA
MFGAPGLPDLLVTPVIIMLLFAVSCVSEDGKDLGSVIGSIRKGLNEDADRQFGLATCPLKTVLSAPQT